MVSTFKQHSVLPGFNLALGFTLLYLSLIVLIPLVGGIHQDGGIVLAGVLGHGDHAEGRRLLPADIRRISGRSVVQCGLRLAGGLGAGALSISRQADRRCAGRSAVCPADRGCRHCPDCTVCRQWLDRPLVRTLRHQDCIHSARSLHRADLHRPAVRGAHGAACAGGPGSELEEAAASLGPRGCRLSRA